MRGALRRSVVDRLSLTAFLLTLAVGCSNSDPAGTDPSEPTPPMSDATEPAVDGCGNFVCGFGEGCASCPIDCGQCARQLTFWPTEPLPDASAALGEDTVGGLERALLADLERAEQAIRIASYTFSRQNVATALGLALGRGVDVRVVTECENQKGAQARLLDELRAMGAQVKDDRSSFGGTDADCPEPGGSMHHKFLIVDEHLVWAGSANLTATDLNYNHNHAFRIEDPAAGAYFSAEWGELWAGRFGRNKQSRAPLDVQIGGARLRVAFSPGEVDGASLTRSLVLEAVSGAGRQVDFAAFSFTDSAVAAALVAGSGRVQGIVDAASAAQSSSRVRELCDEGIPVTIENLPGKVHHKLATVDAGEGDGIVVGGSANWSAGGFDENDETLVVAHDADLALQAAAEVERLVRDPAHGSGPCCFHSAEAFDELSALCGAAPCVCQNGLDDDFDGDEDADDSGCAEPFTCPG